MVEEVLREGHSLGIFAEEARELEAFCDRQVGFDNVERAALHLGFLDYLCSPLAQHVVHSAEGLAGGRDFAHEYRLKQSGAGCDLQALEESSSAGDDLGSVSVDGVGVDLGVDDVEPASPGILFSEDS